MSAPVIGLTSYRDTAGWGAWSAEADLLFSGYARSVEQAGGAPVLLPPQRRAHASAVVSRLDGLIITGGPDVDPARYGQPADGRSGGWQGERDAWEFALLDAAAAIGRPVLGVCRGLQVMAVWAGGSLVQHLPDQVGHQHHRPGPGRYGAVDIEVVPGTRLHALLGEGVAAACHHHQCVAAHPGLVLNARTADGVPEGFEDPGRGFWLGVQWHPETATDLALFRGLVQAAGG